MKYEVLAAPETLRIVLKCFADKLWESIERQNLGELESNFKVYYNSVIDLLGLRKRRCFKMNDTDDSGENAVVEKK